MPTDTPLWRQFRRLLLGAVVEAILPTGIDLDVRTLVITFDDASAFRVPRLDNYMRFRGTVRGALRAPVDAATRARLLAGLRAVWPEIVSVVDLPIGDALTIEKSDVQGELEGDTPVNRFDLSAD